MRSLSRLFALVALVFLSAHDPARAADTGCEAFKWPVTKERAAFDASPTAVQAEADLAAADGAWSVSLASVDQLRFAHAPERPPKRASYGAVLHVPAPLKPGLFQVTLSDEAWIDVLQAGALVKSGEFSGVKGCDGVRKSVRFILKAEPIIVQLSSASSAVIKLALRPIEGP